MIEFVNILLVPVITLSVLYRRSGKPFEKSFTCLKEYVYAVIAVLIATFAIIKVAESLIGIGPTPESPVYTIPAVIVAFVLPYIYEVIHKYMDIKCEISAKNKEGK